MKPVKQTKFERENANCYAACLASIFEAGIEDVPQPAPDELADSQGWARYEARVQAEFLRPRGFFAISAPHRVGGHRPPGYSILTAQSPRNKGALHSVVALDGEIVFDPFLGDVKKLGRWHDWTVFMALDPAGVSAKEAHQSQ